jgi:hypothetical protein
MANLSIASQAKLQDAIDLMVKGSARETPVADDVIERLAIFAQNVSAGSPVPTGSGIIYEAFRDRPFSALIEFVFYCGMDVLTDAQNTALVEAAELMTQGTAYETPFAEDVITRLAPVAEATGFLTLGGFREAIRDRPVSTMLQWSLRLGSQ